MKLHNILTQEVMSGDIRSQLLSVMEIDTKGYESLRKESFVEKSEVLINNSLDELEEISQPT